MFPMYCISNKISNCFFKYYVCINKFQFLILFLENKTTCIIMFLIYWLCRLWDCVI